MARINLNATFHLVNTALLKENWKSSAYWQT
jgi:hypothetical protein